VGTRLKYLGDVEDLPLRICNFRCECGVEITKPLAWVRHGNTTSCGCRKRELVASKNFKHGNAERENASGAYRSWQAMNQRVVVNPLYQDREVCVRWQGESGFKHFLEDMGERPPQMSLDSRNNEKGYSPSNCRWATSIQQANNTRSNVFVMYNGKLYPQAELINAFGITHGLVKNRMRCGISRLAAITTPVNRSKSHKGTGPK